MDLPNLPKKLLLAGKDYHFQLQKLGLKPEATLWVHDLRKDRFVLWLVWSGVDVVGPYEVTKLLFKAYRASALTQEIDPFFVHARSAADVLGQGVLSTTGARRGTISEVGEAFRLDEEIGDEISTIFQWKREWVYTDRKGPKPRSVVNRDWKKFTANVEKLAA